MTTTLHGIVSDKEDSYIPVTDAAVRMDRDSVAIECLMEFSDIVDAYLKGLDMSGRKSKEVSEEMGIPEGYLNRILNRNTKGSERRFMQGETLIRYMLACGNSVPLQWLIYRFAFYTGFVTLPGNKKIQVRVVDGLPSFGSEYCAADELRDVKALLEELFEARRQLRKSGADCSVVMDLAAERLFSELASAEVCMSLLQKDAVSK